MPPRKIALVLTSLWVCLSAVTGHAALHLVAADGTQYLPLVLGPPEVGAIQAPVLKWEKGGCYSSWCETGWYSSAAVADLDGDGRAEVIGSAYSIFVLDGATGVLEWQVASGHDGGEPGADPVGRTWPGGQNGLSAQRVWRSLPDSTQPSRRPPH